MRYAFNALLALACVALVGCSALGIKFSLDVPGIGKSNWESTGTGIVHGVPQESPPVGTNSAKAAGTP